MAADVAQGEQVALGEESPQRQGGVQAGGSVTLGQDKAVPVLPLRVLGIHVHLFKVQVGKQVSGGQAAAGMAGLGGVGSLNNTHAHLAGGGHQLLFF